MKEYNDYVATTKGYLRSYNIFKASIINLEEELALYQTELALNMSCPSMIAKYGDEPGGGNHELNGVEAAAEKNIAKSQSCAELTEEIKKVKGLLARIDRAIEQLSENEQYLIRGFYLEGKTWEELGYELAFSERWARDAGRKAVRKIAVMIFGMKAADPSRFVFAN